MTILRDLLAIKTFRENKAEMAVHRQRVVLSEAVQAYEQAQAALKDFRDWAQRRERELFDDLCSRTVRLREIQNVHEAVGEMRTQENHHIQEQDKAQEHRDEEQVELEACKQVHADASRMKEKFVELARDHAEVVGREIERKEDAEMEEVAELRRDRADWAEYMEDAA